MLAVGEINALPLIFDSTGLFRSHKAIGCVCVCVSMCACVKAALHELICVGPNGPSGSLCNAAFSLRVRFLIFTFDIDIL